MANGFTLLDRRYSVPVSNVAKEAYLDTQFYQNCGLEFSNGMVKPVNAQADVVYAVYNSLSPNNAYFPGSRPILNKSHATLKDLVLCIPTLEGPFEFLTDMTGVDALAIANVSADANTDLSTAICTYAAGTTGDFNGGSIFANGEQRNILTSVRASNTWTFTVDKPFKAAPTTGSKITATHLNAGIQACKLSSSAPYLGISATKGDETGGKVEIVRMLLDHLKPQAEVRFLR